VSFGIGFVAAMGVRTMTPDMHDVPPAGLDRSGIRLGLDRRSIRARDDGVLRWSDRSVAAALALTAVLALARDTGHPDLRGLAARIVLYAEASLCNDVATTALKASIARPRPILYEGSWSGDYRPSSWDFESMPSGHASRSWCAASFALVDHLYSRPGARAWENATVGFAAGAVAGATAALRVRGGAHFPSDVLAGAGIGTACGVGVPLLHGYHVNGRPVPRPGRRRWLVAAGGLAAGTLAGVGIAQLAGGP
jgi:membrane-associated phospholipid phosphatase